MSNIKVVEYTVPAVAVAKHIDLGFIPVYIKIVNGTSRASLEYFETLATGESIKQVSSGTRSKLSTGISIDDPESIEASTDPFGFTIDASLADINDTEDEKLHIVAFRGIR